MKHTMNTYADIMESFMRHLTMLVGVMTLSGLVTAVLPPASALAMLGMVFCLGSVVLLAGLAVMRPVRLQPARHFDTRPETPSQAPGVRE